MAALVIDYDELKKISSYSNSIAKKADDYADSLTQKIAKKVDSVAGGVNSALSSAKYYVEAKVDELEKKKTAYETLAKDITGLIGTAKRVDKEVANAIAINQETFLKSNEHLRIDDWKADIINWLVDLKNSCPIFEIIGDGLSYISTAISSALDNIKYWYKCEGGKEILEFVAAIGGTVLAIALFVATLPASGFFAICAAIGAFIAAINAIVNVITSYKSMVSSLSGDPAWAKIYGDQDKLTDWLRQKNFNNGIFNRLSYGFATFIDTVELFCDIVNIIDLVKKFRFKFDFLHNYFNKNTGLLSYMKTAKWTDALQYDEFGNITGVTKAIKVNEYGIVETRYTFKSIMNGLKAFVMDKPIDAHSELGIRTLLNQNFVTDFKTFAKTTFSVTGWKETFKYNVTDGGRVTFNDWKASYSFTGWKETIKYNVKNCSLKGIFASNIEWKDKKDYIVKAAKEINFVASAPKKAVSLIIGEYDIIGDVKKKLGEKSDIIKIKNKIDSLVTKMNNFKKNTYQYKSAMTTN